jgi:hypothetical protein
MSLRAISYKLSCIQAVKIFALLELEPPVKHKNKFNGAGKIENFSKVYYFCISIIY